MRARVGSLGLACFLFGAGCGQDTPTDGAAGGSSSGASTTGGMALGGAQSVAGTSSGGAKGGAPPGGGSDPGGTSAGGAGGGAGGAAGSGGGATMLSGTPVVFIGGNGDNYPLRVYDLNKTTGALAQRGGDFDAGSSPMYLTLDPTRTRLYAANETGGQAGGITALSINPDGSLTQLNHEQSSGGDKSFTHLTLDPSGKFVLGASYNGGSVSVFPINPNGSIGAEVDKVDFGPDAKAHCVALDPTGRYVLIPTLGNNRVEQLSLSAAGILSANTPPNVSSAAGAGPRHIAIHPSGKLAFVINELNSSVTPYQLSEAGLLTAGTTLSSLPNGFNGGNSGAHIELSPDGRFVYASNRGHNSIVVFSADQTTGALTLVEHEATRGNTPRDFDVDPNGDVLIVANQGNALLTVYKIETNGGLTPLGEPVAGPPNPTAVQIHYLP